MKSVDNRTMTLIKQTLLEMLKDRGYNIGDYKIDKADTDNLAENEFSALRMVVQKDQSLLAVIISPEPKVSLKGLKTILSDCEKQNIRDIIVVAQDGLNPIAMRMLSSTNYSVTVFKMKELMFNVTRHVLVPPHRLMSSEEKAEFLAKRKMKLNELPKMLKTDPVAKYYGAKKGDVFEIERVSETAGTSLYYRVVI